MVPRFALVVTVVLSVVASASTHASEHGPRSAPLRAGVGKVDAAVSAASRYRPRTRAGLVVAVVVSSALGTYLALDRTGVSQRVSQQAQFISHLLTGSQAAPTAPGVLATDHLSTGQISADEAEAHWKRLEEGRLLLPIPEQKAPRSLAPLAQDPL